jgi:peroxiredoxin
MNHPKSIVRIFFAAGIFLVGTAIILFLSNNSESDLQISSSIRVPATANYSAPEFYLHDLQENDVSLSNYRGFVVLVNNWATWCPPCKAEMPELLAYYEAHISDGFVLVAIESGEPLEEVTAFVQRYKLTFPIWLDPRGIALEAFNNWNLPSSYVIDRDGTVRYFWTGPVDLSTLDKYITPLLEE